MTMSAFIFQTIDEENLKQLNDEQLLRLLEEAYHSKKLDEKNKSAIFKVRLNFHEYITYLHMYSELSLLLQGYNFFIVLMFS